MLGLGEPLIAMLPDRVGPLRSVPQFRRGLGGAECNVVSGMARLGLRCGLMSRVGDDEFGAFVLATLAGAGVDTSAVVVDPEAPTGIYFRGLTPFRDSSLPAYYRSGSAASRMTPESLDRGLLSDTSALITTGITALLSARAYECVREALVFARASGCVTVFDPNLRLGLWGSDRAAELLPPLLAEVDVYLGGADETRLLLESDCDACELASAVAALGPREVVIRQGPEGALALTPEGWVDQPAYPVLMRDPVGAGDAFNAGYLALREMGAPLADAVRAGTICASAVCATLGDFEAFPTRNELDSHLYPDAESIPAPAGRLYGGMDPGRSTSDPTEPTSNELEHEGAPDGL